MKYIKSYKIFENYRSGPELFLEEIKDWVTKYHNNIHGEYKTSDITDFREMCYYLNPWDYVDDDKFIEDYIDGEIDYQVSDWSYLYDSKYDKEEWLIPYIEELLKKDKDNKIGEDIYKRYMNEYMGIDIDDENDVESYSEEIKDNRETIVNSGYDWMLEDLENKQLKDIIDEFDDISTFIREVLEDRYKNQSAYDILSEIYSKSDLDSYPDSEFWRNDYSNILYYIDETKMQKDLPDEEWEWEDIVNNLDIESNNELQEEIFEQFPGKILDMVDNECVGEKLGNTYDFQKAYFDKCIEEDNFLDGVEIEEDYNIELNRIEKLLDLGINIDDDISDEYNIQHIIDSKELGLL